VSAAALSLLRRDGYATDVITVEQVLSHRAGFAEHPAVPSYVVRRHLAGERSDVMQMIGAIARRASECPRLDDSEQPRGHAWVAGVVCAVPSDRQ
jgi:CubicO group peptidase (beta-lactamase class C family)